MALRPVALSADPRHQSWYEASARARLAGLLDPDGFREFIGPEQRMMSPHLPLFDLPRAFDDGMVVGEGTLDGRAVLVAAQEGRFMGGAFGEIHGAKLVGLLRAALVRAPAAVLILFDTGGVRLQEANAGETAIAEVMRAIAELRAAGVPVIGLIGGRAGCYGGGGLIAGTCSRLVVSEGGRISVSGPEVIETNKGAEEFDSRDRALVWRTMGGKHRRLMGGADAFVDDTILAFREAALAQIPRAAPFDLATLAAEQARLEARLARFGDCPDATDIWGRLGIDDPTAVPGLTTEAFDALLARLPEALMRLAEILASLFPDGHAVRVADGLIGGHGPFAATTLAVIGIDGATPLGIEGALTLAGAVLAVVRAGGDTPILVLVDSDSQRMSRRDELLGLNEYLAHLAKALLLADASGHPTIGLVYGHTAAGAFIATALATRVLAALPGASPSVMDLPSVARITKLPLEQLQAMARTTSVFAPGLDNMVQAGAVHAVLAPDRPLGPQIAELIANTSPCDVRDTLGRERGGRTLAHDVAARVMREVHDG